MKKLKQLMIAAMLIMAFIVTGCSDQDVVDDKPVEKVMKASVTVDYAKEDVQANNEFIDPRYKDSEYLEKLEIKSDQDITDVIIYEVEMGNATGKPVGYFVKDIIYEQDIMKKDEALLFGTEFPNFTPHLVMCYTDTDKTEKMFSIGMSGKDSSIVCDDAVLQATLNFELKDKDASFDEENTIVYLDSRYETSEYLVHALITTDQPIHNLKIFDATVQGEEDGMQVFKANEEIYVLESLSAQDTFAFKTEFSGDIPNTILTYEDATNTERTLALTLSGKDGSIMAIDVILEK